MIEVEKSCSGFELEDKVIDEVDEIAWVEELLIFLEIPSFQVDTYIDQDLSNNILVVIAFEKLW